MRNNIKTIFFLEKVTDQDRKTAVFAVLNLKFLSFQKELEPRFNREARF